MVRHPLTVDIGLGVLVALLMLLLRRTLLTERWIVSIVPSMLFGALYVLAVRLARVYPQRAEPGGRRALQTVLIEAGVVLVLFLVLAVVL